MAKKRQNNDNVCHQSVEFPLTTGFPDTWRDSLARGINAIAVTACGMCLVRGERSGGLKHDMLEPLNPIPPVSWSPLMEARPRFTLYSSSDR